VIDTLSIHLPHIRFAWSEIMRLAKRSYGPGHRIRVKDDAGGIVILTGVNAVRHHNGNGDQGDSLVGPMDPVAFRPLPRRARSKKNLAAQK